jgi:hypothetical protein
MRATRLFAVLVLMPFSAFAATEDADDWKLVGGVLAVMQQILHAAAHSPDPQAAQKGVESVLGGENPQANRVASGVMEEVMQDLPPEYRGAFVSIGRDLLTMARRERARAAALAPEPMDASKDAAILARRDLHAMGLAYWDEKQFAEAVKRGDRIAVDLYIAARGLPANSSPRNLPPAR